MSRPHWKLLAIDLDGTLLDSQHALPLANREALHRAHEAGLHIVLCTGRAFAETVPVVRDIGLDLDATVTVFGALVTEVRTGRTLDRTSMPLDVAWRLTEWLRQTGYPVLWLTDPNETGHDGYVQRGPNWHPAVDQWLQRTPCQVARVDAIPGDAAAPLRISIIDDSPALEAVSLRLRDVFSDQLTHNILHAPPYRLSLIEAFAPQVSKWYAVSKLCDWWGVDPSRTVAVGDDVNDLQMIREAGLGVAVANARPAVRDAAARVVASNDDAGVAELISQLLESDRAAPVRKRLLPGPAGLEDPI